MSSTLRMPYEQRFILVPRALGFQITMFIVFISQYLYIRIQNYYFRHLLLLPLYFKNKPDQNKYDILPFQFDHISNLNSCMILFVSVFSQQ